MVDSGDEDVKENESSDYEDAEDAAPPAAKRRRTGGAKSPRKKAAGRKTAKGKNESAEVIHLQGRQPQRDAIPPLPALEHVASFVNDLDTLAALSSTCKDLRYKLVHAPGAWRRWRGVLGLYSDMNQGDAAATFALPPRVLKANCSYRIEVRTRRGAYGKYDYERHMFNLKSVFDQALKPRRKRKGASDKPCMAELFRAREERARRQAAAGRAKETKLFRARHINVLEAKMERFEAIQDSVAAYCPSMVSLLTERLTELREKIAQADREKEAALATEVRDGQPMKDVQSLCDLIRAVSSAKKYAESWVWEGSSESSEIQEKLNEVMAACKDLKAWNDIQAAVSVVRGNEQSLQEAYTRRHREIEREACAPFEAMLNAATDEDRKLTPDERDKKIRDALAKAGCFRYPPNSGLLRAYIDWTFIGDELCWMEVVGVRRAVDILADDGMLRFLPSDLSGRIRSQLVTFAIETYHKEKKPWQPTEAQLLDRVVECGVDEGNAVSTLHYDDDSDSYMSYF